MNSDQSGGMGPVREKDSSLVTFSIVSAVETTWTRKTGMACFRNACTSRAAFCITTAGEWGCVGRAAIPFWRSITTRAVLFFARSRLVIGIMEG